MDDSTYFDAGAGKWRDDDAEGWIDERPEDDAQPDTTERDDKRDEDDEEIQRRHRRKRHRRNHRDREDVAGDPEDDPAFRTARREHAAMSGRVVNYGRKRTTNPTGLLGRGVRGLRAGSSSGPPEEVRPRIRPTGRQLGGRAPVVGRPSLEDAPELVGVVLGPERITLLRASLTKRGANRGERAARAYLAVLLRLLDHTAANRAAADLLGSDLRKIGDLRRRAYPPEAEAAALAEIEWRLSNNVRPRSYVEARVATRQTTYGRGHR